MISQIHNKLFSLIIPCHNPEKTMLRLFDSLTRQHISNNDLEIIVVDDGSDNLAYQEKLKSRYRFDMRFEETQTSIHCPGNARRKGMEYVTGQWVFFCDQDDFFEDDALLKVKDYIQKTNDHTIYVVSTIMRAYDDKTNTCHQDFAHKQAWLHGKWYSMDNLIIPYKINFKENLKTHEDIYFNSSVLSVLFEKDTFWDCIDIYTYRWVDNPESLTRKPTNDRGYLFENFNDYLVSAGEPFWEKAKISNNPIFFHQIMMTLLHAYFYYESASYYDGPTNYADIIKIIKNYIKLILIEFNITPEYIIDYIYVDPYLYKAVLEDCEIYCGTFIPKTSFRDFIFRLSQ